MMSNISLQRFYTPLALPILFFLAAILTGTILLHGSFSTDGGEVAWLDALFTATSAVCVTGLTVVDTGSGFSPLGQSIILGLIQLGGLGIMSFTSLALYLWRKKVSLVDRMAVGQSLLFDSSFHLGSFLLRIVVYTFSIELAGALLLYGADPGMFSPFSAIFHSVSAFCNAGFSLFAYSLEPFKGNWPVNTVFMVLITLGGLGFFILVEGKSYLEALLTNRKINLKKNWHFGIVVSTSLLLVLTGWAYIFTAEYLGSGPVSLNEAILTSLFQSVTCRTAGFNTLAIGELTNATLVFMMFLMLIGGSSGSCAGGIKVTTFRVLWAFVAAQLKGREQVVIGRFGVDRESINRALILLFFSIVFILFCVLLLNFSEGGNIPHDQARGTFLELLFEAVSAFGTVGLSMGVTDTLSPFGKAIIIMMMFVGRLGPLVLLSALQSMRTRVMYAVPEEKLPIG